MPTDRRFTGQRAEASLGFFDSGVRSPISAPGDLQKSGRHGHAFQVTAVVVLHGICQAHGAFLVPITLTPTPPPPRSNPAHSVACRSHVNPIATSSSRGNAPAQCRLAVETKFCCAPQYMQHHLHASRDRRSASIIRGSIPHRAAEPPYRATEPPTWRMPQAHTLTPEVCCRAIPSRLWENP